MKPALRVACILPVIACNRGEPPTWDAGALETVSLPSARASSAPGITKSPGALPAAAAEADASTAGPSGTEPTAGAADDTLPTPPPDDGALPQTRDMPSATSPALLARARLLAAAIAADNPEIGMPFFFPKAAYEQVKDVGNPGRDWKIRLQAAYARDIRDDHRKLGSRASEAKFVALEIPEGRARWVEPGEEYNKLGYFRVFASRLVLDVGGRRRTLEIKSLIGWRGEWYVVHFAGMK